MGRRNRYYAPGITVNRIFLLSVLVALLCGFCYVEIGIADAPPLEATMISLDHQLFPFIYLNVAVDRFGEGISTLTKSNFQVTENGISQTGTEFFDVTPPEEAGEVRRADIIFVLDVTGSMGGEIESVRTNMLSFVNALAASDVNYRVGFVVFGDVVYVYNDGNLYTEQAEILSIINNITLGEHGIGSGGDAPENQFEAMAQAASMNYRPGTQRVQILLTDAPAHEADGVTDWTRETIANLLVGANTTVFPVFDTLQSAAKEQYIPIAEATNPKGTYFNIYDDFNTIIDEIATIVASTYVVQYKSSNPVFDGTERHVLVTVSYLSDQATCDGAYIPGSSPKIGKITVHDTSAPPWAAGTPLTVEAEITDEVAPYVDSATLYYRRKDDPAYTPTPMTHSSDTWSGTIPGSAVETPWVAYYISATDTETTVTDPSTDPGERPHQIAILPNVAPEITHTPPADVPVDTPITITAQIIDTTNSLTSARLYYRKVGKLDYHCNGEMTNTGGDNYRDTIPSDFVTAAGVEYYILAVDDLGTENSFGTRDDPQQVWIATNQPPNTEIKTREIDSVNGTAKFTWSGSDDTTPAKDLLYCYRLRKDSSYSGWSTWSASTTKTYTNLSPGSYRFQVKAKDADEAIQPDSATWEFVIGAAPSEFWVQVYNTGSTLAIRKTPGTKNKPADDILKRVPDGWALKVLSTVDENGNTVVKDGFTWWKVEESEYESQPNTGWVAKKYLKEVSFVSTPPSSPEGLTKAEWEAVADEAVQWATHDDRIGSDEWKGLCARFVANAFGQATAGYNADDLAEYLKGKGLLYPNPEKGIYGNPPRGALIFFKPAKINEWYGHVGIYLGNGKMVNQYVDIRVMALKDYSTSVGYKGWAYPPKEWIKQPLVASFTYIPQNPVVDRWITFDASASSPRNKITSYAWNFGDSELVKYGVQVKHSYSQAALHTVSLTVSDGRREKTTTLTVPVSLYGGEYILPAPSDPPSLEYAHFNDEERIEIHKLVARVLFMIRKNEEMKEGQNVDRLVNRLGFLLDQIHPDLHAKDLHQRDLIRDGALSENQELLVSALGELAGAGINFLSGVPSPLTGTLVTTGAQMLSFYFVDKWYLSDLATATVVYPTLGRMEIIWFRPPQNKILVHAWLEEPFNQSVFIAIPLEERPRRTAFGLYECPIWWCGLICPAEYALKELTPRLADVEITWLDSPGELLVHDSLGNATGLADGTAKTQIPDSSYDPDTKTVLVFGPKGKYAYEVTGIDKGTYTLGVSSIYDNGDAITFTGTNISIAQGAVHQYFVDWDLLAQGEEGVTLEIDADGDGIPERTVTSDSDLEAEDFGVVPTGQVLNLGPNPVPSGGCVFWFNLPEEVGQVRLMLFSISGRLVFETSIDLGATRFPSAGTWNPVDNAGVELANGPYVYVLVADGKVIGRGKMVIQR